MKQPETRNNHVAGANREKTRVKKWELVFVLFLINLKSGASFFFKSITKGSNAKPKQTVSTKENDAVYVFCRMCNICLKFDHKNPLPVN